MNEPPKDAERDIQRVRNSFREAAKKRVKTALD